MSRTEAWKQPGAIAEFRAANLVDQIVKLLESAQLDCSSEAVLQEGIARVLGGAGIRAEREHQLSIHDRIDFFVKREGVGIEVKIGGGLADVTRQLFRYADHDDVKRLVLVTSRLQLRGVPDKIFGKPVRVAALLGSLF